MDRPPAQNSANHILNALHNDCIKLCFRELTNVRDFLSAAEVCENFQANALACFPPAYKKIVIHDWFYFDLPNGLPTNRIKNFLFIFGHLIESIEWTSTDTVYTDRRECIARNQNADIEILHLISDYCGKTLKRFEIWNQFPNFETRSPFKMLTKLELYNAPPLHFDLYSQLTCLQLSRYSTLGNWLLKTFPNLKCLVFKRTNELNDDTVDRILTLNPQLENLDIMYCDKLTTSIFKNIGSRVPNLTTFKIAGTQFSIDTNMMDLSQLKNLKTLSLECSCDSVGNLIDKLAENHIPIEQLVLNKVTRDISDELMKLKRLKELRIGGTADEILANIVKKQIALKKLNIFAASVSFDGIKSALEHGKNLTELSVYINNTNRISFSLHMYNTILKFVKDRVKFELKFSSAEICVPEHILIANKKCVNIHSLE